ncbi:uncharacterized protein BDZ99DRAFT_503839 [Mytilinidion resinicola]|uniref:Rhodopsin domain-containing protein n=1 Tax=Mytilinidion resinicola TaxID=574789 RepID=A0A6A6Y0S0_9PEZI|nr:uncharacterized protein BDZ99DRAFT_503839 [Mytilinidion resinicola]KAF2802362.1 hypothetical protein BDZ99DRAFT_503839 [Mytilinidion resinicola]
MRLEDYLVMAAWAVFSVYLYYVYGICISPGIFMHQWDVRYIDFVHILYNMAVGSVLYGSVISLTKTAILLDWLHIFVPQRTRNALAWTIYVLITINCLYYTAGILADIFECMPRKKIWDKTTPGTCINTNAGFVVAAVLNLANDLIILALPQKVIWGLHLTPSKKVGISGMFAIGIFACVCAVARLVYSIKLMHSEDVAYSVSPVGVWSIGEMTSAFLIVGVPSLPRIFKVPWVQSVFTWIQSLTGGSSKGTRESSRKGLPSWYKNAPTARRRQDDVYSELDEYRLEAAEMVYSPHNGITRQNKVEMHSSHM